VIGQVASSRRASASVYPGSISAFERLNRSKLTAGPRLAARVARRYASSVAV
jgi:hypothetical protein